MDINKLLISGRIISPVRRYESGKVVFTLANRDGRFYVEWRRPTWVPEQGGAVLVNGAVRSRKQGGRDVPSIQAEEISPLRGANPRLRGR